MIGPIDRAGRDLPNEADRLQTLNEIGRVMSSTLRLRTLYETIYEQIGRVMDASQFFIALLQEDAGVVEVPYLREEGALVLDLVLPLGESVTSMIIRRGMPVLFHTTEDYDALVRAYGLVGSIVGSKDSESGIFVPLHTGSRTIGALSVQSPRPHAYTDDDVQMLSVLASQAAVAIENARLYARSEDNVRQMQALLEVAQIINGSLDLPTVLEAILTSMRKVIPYYFAAILMPDHARGHLDVIDSVGAPNGDQIKLMKIPFGQGVTGTVYSGGQPLIANDVTSFPGYIDHGIAEIRAEMAVPLRRGDTVVGVLDVERDRTDGFAAQELALLSLFASQAAIAIENARLFADQQQRVFELQTIQSIVQKLTLLHDVETMARVVERELRALIDYNICGIFMLDARRQVLMPVIFEGTRFPISHVTLGEGLTGWVALHGRSALVHDSEQDDRVAPIPGSPQRPESLLSTPLIFEGKVQGVITLSKLQTNQFDENSVRLLEIVAAQTAIAFHRARLYDELRTEAVTDPLTRLYNRRYLLDRLHEEQSRAQRNSHPLAVLMLDIDRFKEVNDRHGHDAGDRVLIELASLLRRTMRAEDLVARYGGEEFCLLVPEVGPADGFRLAERLRRIVAEHAISSDIAVPRVTVSVGIAFLAQSDTDTEVVTRADLAMYRAKSSGGDRVCVACPADINLPESPAGSQAVG